MNWKEIWNKGILESFLAFRIRSLVFRDVTFSKGMEFSSVSILFIAKMRWYFNATNLAKQDYDSICVILDIIKISKEQVCGFLKVHLIFIVLQSSIYSPTKWETLGCIYSIYIVITFLCLFEWILSLFNHKDLHYPLFNQSHLLFLRLLLNRNPLYIMLYFLFFLYPSTPNKDAERSISLPLSDRSYHIVMSDTRA